MVGIGVQSGTGKDSVTTLHKLAYREGKSYAYKLNLVLLGLMQAFALSFLMTSRIFNVFRKRICPHDLASPLILESARRVGEQNMLKRVEVSFYPG